MKERVVLVGAGQHAKVVIYNIEEQAKYEIVGIVDANPQKINSSILGYKVTSTYDNLSELEQKYGTNNFIISFGNMNYRKNVFDRFVASGWKPINVIHPNAVISPYARIGKGVLIECGALITPDPIIGDNVVVNTGTQVNHDNVIEDHVFLAGGVVLSGGVTIKSNTLIDDGVIVSLGKTVGSDCIVGAGSVVTKDIPNNSICYGNPARVIRNNK